MATTPTTLPEWASQDQNDPVTGAPNKIEPTPSFKLSGVNRNEAILRAYLNYELDNIADWVSYLDDATISGQASTSGGSVQVTIPDQLVSTYRVVVTPKSNLGNFWVVNDSSTQFTINVSSGNGSVDWIVASKQ